MEFDIENAGMGTEEHAIHIAELYDNKELAESKAEEINFALKLMKIVKDQIKTDNDFMQESNMSLSGTFDTMVRRGILEGIWSEAKLG